MAIQLNQNKQQSTVTTDWLMLIVLRLIFPAYAVPGHGHPEVIAGLFTALNAVVPTGTSLEQVSVGQWRGNVRDNYHHKYNET